MLRYIYLIVLVSMLTGFTFISEDDLPALNSSRIVIRSEVLVGLKLTIDDDFVIISQDDLLDANSASIVADKGSRTRLEQVVVEIDSGTHTVIISDLTGTLLRVKLYLSSGDVKELRLRR